MAYAYKRTLTVTSSSSLLPSTQTNFPTLVYLSDPSLKTAGAGGHIQNTVTQASGPAVTMPADLIFTSDSAGLTAIPWEIESYDATNGVLWAWVKISSLALSTVFFCFYGDGSVSSAQNTGSFTPANVWDTNFKAVWHLGDGTTLRGTDSIGVNNGTLTNTPAAVAGQVAGAGSFVSASSQYIATGTNAALNITGDLTISAWVKTSANSASIFKRYKLSGSFDGYGFDLGAGGSGGAFNGCASFWSSVKAAWVHGNTTVNDNAWHHVAISLSGTTATFYRDGAADGTPASNAAGTWTATGSNIATDSGATGSFMNGALDEIQVSATARSANWIAAAYNNQNAPATFVAVGPEVATATGRLFRVPSLSGLGSGGGFFHNPLN